MKYHLVSGGCGFVGRNVAKYLYRNTQDTIIIVDDLSVGVKPTQWIAVEDTFGTNQPNRIEDNIEYWGEGDRIIFWEGDFRQFLLNDSIADTTHNEIRLVPKAIPVGSVPAIASNLLCKPYCMNFVSFSGHGGAWHGNFLGIPFAVTCEFNMEHISSSN